MVMEHGNRALTDIYSREQRAKWASVHAHLATAARGCYAPVAHDRH